jgi:hypothetical protein
VWGLDRWLPSLFVSTCPGWILESMAQVLEAPAPKKTSGLVNSCLFSVRSPCTFRHALWAVLSRAHQRGDESRRRTVDATTRHSGVTAALGDTAQS